jgi:hypothetical protein
MKAFHFHIPVTQFPILIVEISNSLVFLCKGKSSNPEYRTVYGEGGSFQVARRAVAALPVATQPTQEIVHTEGSNG